MHLVADRDLPQFAGTPRGRGASVWGRPVRPHERRVVADGLFSEALRPMAEAVGSLMVALGGHGRAHVALRVAARGFWLEHPIEHSLARRSIPEKDDRHPIPLLPIQSWTDAELGVDDELLQSMKRELLRACGFPEWEPGP
jgi:hypothetical protein